MRLPVVCSDILSRGKAPVREMRQAGTKASGHEPVIDNVTVQRAGELIVHHQNACKPGSVATDGSAHLSCR